MPPKYKDHLTIKTTSVTAQRWSLYQGSTVLEKNLWGAGSWTPHMGLYQSKTNSAQDHRLTSVPFFAKIWSFWNKKFYSQGSIDDIESHLLSLEEVNRISDWPDFNTPLHILTKWQLLVHILPSTSQLIRSLSHPKSIIWTHMGPLEKLLLDIPVIRTRIVNNPENIGC